MENYLVSICLPTYNRPVTLERTLNSLVNQTYPHLEIIVSDNCSPDPEVATVIQKFKADKRIKYYRQETNKGPIFNFNFVLSKVTGDFFMKMADDDWIDDNYVESCLQYLLKNQDYSAAYGAAKIFTKDGALHGKDVETDMTEDDAGKRVRKYLMNVGFNSTYYALMRKQYLKYVTSKNVLAVDWIIVARVAFSGKFKLLDYTYTNISLGGDSSSIESIISTYGMSDFTKKYPYLSICRNVFLDILLYSAVYKKLNFIKRYTLAKNAAQLIYVRFNVKNEIETADVRHPFVGMISFKEKLITRLVKHLIDR